MTRSRLTAERKHAMLLDALTDAWNAGLRRVTTHLLLLGQTEISREQANVYGRKAFAEPTSVEIAGEIALVCYARGEWTMR